MDIIDITESNYQDYSSLDIVAFSFAYEGAMGEMGGIYIIDREGQIYHANYFLGDDCIDREHIKDVIPVFVDLEHGLMGSESNNPNWSSEYLGFGNTLLISNEIRDGFKKKVEEAKFQRTGELFQQWPGFVLNLIGKENDSLTMNEIWELLKK